MTSQVQYVVHFPKLWHSLPGSQARPESSSQSATLTLSGMQASPVEWKLLPAHGSHRPSVPHVDASTCPSSRLQHE